MIEAAKVVRIKMTVFGLAAVDATARAISTDTTVESVFGGITALWRSDCWVVVG